MCLKCVDSEAHTQTETETQVPIDNCFLPKTIRFSRIRPSTFDVHTFQIHLKKISRIWRANGLNAQISSCFYAFLSKSRQSQIIGRSLSSFFLFIIFFVIIIIIIDSKNKNKTYIVRLVWFLSLPFTFTCTFTSRRTLSYLINTFFLFLFLLLCSLSLAVLSFLLFFNLARSI